MVQKYIRQKTITITLKVVRVHLGRETRQYKSHTGVGSFENREGSPSYVCVGVCMCTFVHVWCVGGMGSSGSKIQGIEESCKYFFKAK